MIQGNVSINYNPLDIPFSQPLLSFSSLEKLMIMRDKKKIMRDS